VGVTIAVSLPLTIMNIVYLPLLVRQRLGLGVVRYFWSVTAQPVVHLAPFAICLMVIRLAFWHRAMAGLVWAGAGGSIVLAIIYWRYVIPARIRERVLLYVPMTRKVV